jgi:hypothetical protein
MTDPRIAVLSALSSPGWHPVPEAHGMPWDEAEQLLAAYDASRAAAVPSAPADQTALRDRIAAAIWERQNPGRRWADCEYRWRADAEADADAVLAVLPAPADRTAILREAAVERVRSVLESEAVVGRSALDYRGLITSALMADDVSGPSRVAGEAQQPETQARRDVGRETVEYFIQAQQDDGTWEDASSFMDALDWAAERLAVKRVKYPDFSWRMAERTTTVTVRPLPDCLTCRHWRCNGDGPCGALLDAWQRCACTGPAAASQPGKEATS